MRGAKTASETDFVGVGVEVNVGDVVSPAVPLGSMTQWARGRRERRRERGMGGEDGGRIVYEVEVGVCGKAVRAHNRGWGWGWYVRLQRVDTLLDYSDGDR